MNLAVNHGGFKPEMVRESNDPQVYAAAVRMIGAYFNHQRGITYAMQGLHTGDGVSIPARILDEDAFVHRYFVEYEKAKYQNGS